jgi:hypothetical protein
MPLFNISFCDIRLPEVVIYMLFVSRSFLECIVILTVPFP